MRSIFLTDLAGIRDQQKEKNGGDDQLVIMLSRTEEKTLYLSILIMARVQPLYAQDLGRKRKRNNRTKDVIYVIDKLVRNGLVIETVTRNGEGIPKVTIEITDKGIQYLQEIEQDQKMTIELSTY